LIINNNQPIPMNPGKDDATAVVDVQATVPPGVYNLVLRGAAQVPYNKDPMAKEKPNVNVQQPATPITLTVLPRQVAAVSVDNANPTLKAGAQTMLVVKVARMYEFAGEFTVQLVLPANMKGISADKATIPPGKDETKLILKAPADAAPGARPDIVVQALATINGNIPLTHEAKINVNVVK
jgi:hypothetical protein